MPIEAGTKLGHYEVLSSAGAGGMGEVYKAKDPRLNRTVAVKVLPAHIAERSDLKQRFEREAQTIASLNHPHICVVYDVGQHEGVDFLVMEYLEGETLAEHLARGPIPFDQLLTYATQIADALDKAHRNGVTHRDLKPGNIMVTKNGVKLLDFGLAKVSAAPTQGVSASFVPTMATGREPLTVEGTILGTLQYMSPEQLEGREADARSDIFAFGAILYEMATGRRAFEGKSQVSLIAAILEHDPAPVSAIHAVAPPMFDDVIRICLAKNPDDRWQSAADVLHELKLLVRYGSLPAAAAHRSRKREVAGWVAAAFLLVAALAGFALLRPAEVPAAKMSFAIETEAAPSPLHIAMSPNGRHVVAVANDGTGNRLWLRSMEHLTAQFLPGTSTAGNTFPFWSPDSRFVGYGAEGKLKKVDIFGAPPQSLSDAAGFSGGTWNSDGVILFAPDGAGPLFRVSAAGGVPAQVTELDKARGERAHRFPHFLPDGDHFVFLALSTRQEESGIYLSSLQSKDSRRLLPSNVEAEFAPPDHLLFMREDTLMAQRFDLARLQLSGDPFPVAEGVGSNNGNSVSGFSASANGAIVYRQGNSAGDRRSFVWIDRSGKREADVMEAGPISNPMLSPDSKRLAYARQEVNNGDIWIRDLERGNSSRLTFDAANDDNPFWSPDGSKIVFTSNRDGVGNLYQKSAGGTGNDEVLLKTPNNKGLTDWSADGRYILFVENDPKTAQDIWILPLSGDRKPIPFLNTPFLERGATLSNDSRWIAYQSNETGRDEVYVQSFPASGRKWQISTNGGRRPQWGPDGKELFYEWGGELFSVDLTGTVAGGEFKAGTPQALFPGVLNNGARNFQILPGSRRFLVVSSPDQATGPAPIIVLLNWLSGIKK